jgi:ribulose-phosphate 3-epimerase
MSVASLVADLHTARPLVAPSLLSCDFANVEREIRRVEAAGARLLHLDVMDGHFVPNLSIGVPVVKSIRRVTELPLDVHLMISEPWRYIEPFREAGADLLTIHVEVAPEPQALLEKIRSLGAAAGITLNPPMPVETLRDCLPYCDLVLVMSVMAGFGGQEFEPVALEKLAAVRRWGGEDLLLSVDGGVNLDTVGQCAAAGADLFVTGSALFSQDDYGAFLGQMTRLAKASKDGRD